MVLEGKNVAVLGAGTSGFSAARLAVSHGSTVTVFDSEAGNHAHLKARFLDAGISLVTGEAALNHSGKMDYTVLSPGIPFESALVDSFREDGGEMIGEVELAWRLSSETPVIAITGTNGKTTTTELIAAIMNGAGVSTVPCGNIGLAYSEVVRSKQPLDVMTVELSSFQLESTESFRPTVAVWMNFAPDHMDRYHSIDEYRSAKMNLFKNQTESDWCVLKKEEELDVPGNVVTFSAFTDNAHYWYDDGVIRGPGDRWLLNYQDSGLHGLHNAENVMAAMAASHCAGVDFDSMVPSVMSYKAPPHRSEIVGVKGGVIFVNDSKATNLHALESALSGQESSVVLIAGGKRKGLDYSELNEVIKSSVRQVICIGETASQLEQEWGDIVPCRVAEDLKSAVALSYSLCTEGDTVLFSPGTSSFDMFSGYEERGNTFRAAVEGLN